MRGLCERKILDNFQERIAGLLSVGQRGARGHGREMRVGPQHDARGRIVAGLVEDRSVGTQDGRLDYGSEWLDIWPRDAAALRCTARQTAPRPRFWQPAGQK
jgi:hypothetical protein